MRSRDGSETVLLRRSAVTPVSKAIRNSFVRRGVLGSLQRTAAPNLREREREQEMEKKCKKTTPSILQAGQVARWTGRKASVRKNARLVMAHLSVSFKGRTRVIGRQISMRACIHTYIAPDTYIHTYIHTYTHRPANKNRL